MSLESQITTLEDSVQESYNVLEEKGSEIPAKATLANLASTILGIPEPEKPQYGILSYYSVWNDTITLQDAMECQVNSFNEAKLKAFADANGGFQEYMMFNYEEDWEQGGYRWMYQTPTGSVYIAEDDFLSTTGIDVTVTSEWGFASINFTRALVVDTSSQVESAELTANDWTTFNGGSDKNAYTVNDGAISVPRIAVKGFVFGEFPETIGNYVLSNCDNLTDVDMSYAKFTSTGTYFMAYLYSFNKPVTLPATLKTLGSSFLAGANKTDMSTGQELYTPFNAKVNLPDGLTTIGDNFVTYQQYYNKSVEVPETVTSIGGNFLSNNPSFNSSVTLPSTLTATPVSFLGSCTSFNQIVNIPSTVTSIGSGFLSGCKSFTQTVSIPDTVTSIGDGFLASCRAYNQPIALPAGLTTIGSRFLASCQAYNQPLALPEGLTTIGNYFLSSCGTYNKAIVIPNSVTSIGTYFLESCTGFNQTVTLSTSLTSLGNNFMEYCTTFNQPLTLPNSVTTFGAYFMRHCRAFNNTITLPANLTTIGSVFLSDCDAFNKPLDIPASVTKIEGSFLSDCKAFNTSFSLPEGLLTIGGSFMHGCTSFNKDIVFPSTLTSIGNQFMRSLDKMTKSVNFGALDPAILDSQYRQYNLSVQTNNVPAYTTGITIKGTNRAAWLAALPKITTFPYRNLIDGGE